MDTGPGLSEEDMSKLFKPYGQVSAGELQNGGGRGLGLVICKSFVEAHAGGKIGVHSMGRGEGSTFFFEIFVPLLEGSDKGSRDEIGEEIFSNHSSRSTSRSPVWHAESHQQDVPVSHPAFRLRRRLSDPATPSTRTGDQIPPQFTSPSRKFLKSLAVPMAAGVEEKKGNAGGQKKEQRGPFRASRSSKEKACEGPSSALSPRSVPLTADVLLVDDDRFCLMAGSAVIKRLGFSVQTAEDGDEAVRMIVEDKLSFRLVLMDKNMARMDGPEALKRIREHFSLREAEEKKKGAENQVFVPVMVGCTGDAVKESHEA
uniref:Response regulatory domain-containing protein n=1 Tax=Chromera velia CCMP2878 TaxID=1169474 RepID=A0A0G4HIT8_9ALVE|eukprot:Cvel_1084.t1-p1 / transcript=Cvel_1084.t1 / gene=Cvel_1084 / organism=Chromera_velia_CCMP2878 / gene_product=Two-component response regulator ARR22, putative / transcript_product=Two-component response regulator ARR22, putative / location=Cvel_scaffold35:68984-69925(+) / protein_length=314 / sequence_SO=supercontig / SO=protein_coding / is_pseudo=false